MYKISIFSLLLFMTIFSYPTAQDLKTFGETYLDPTTYIPGIDPDINMYISSWTESMPYHTHGSLVERDILTKGDPVKPVKKGGVLKFVNRFTRASLASYTTTTPTTLKGEQEIIYILSGNGLIKAGTKTDDLYPGITVLVPANLEFTVKNTADKDLTMYLVSEPVPADFKPNSELIVKDESALPVSKGGHWCHEVVTLLTSMDGLAEVENVLVVSIPPMSIAHPHAYPAGQEEVWTAVEGTSIAFLGKQIRIQPPGTAFKVPPDGKFIHSNINQSKEQVKFFYFFRTPEHNLYKK